MRKITVLIFAAIIVALASSSVTAQTDFERSQRRYSSSRCEPGHRVEFVSNGGQIVILEDSSIWKVDTVDAIHSALWLPATDIVACDDKLINTENNETVSARRIR